MFTDVEDTVDEVDLTALANAQSSDETRDLVDGFLGADQRAATAAVAKLRKHQD
jgi:hypothetical protein